MRTKNNITFQEESKINEFAETTKFNINEADIDYDHDDENEELNIMNLDNKNKQIINNKLKLVLFCMCLFILLSLTLFTGAILEKVYAFIDPHDNDPFNNNNIMDKIHIRSEVMRELRGNRTNEEECEARRCCDIRDGLTINDIPQGLDCKLLTDDECGDMDEYCEWDCDLPIIKLRKKGKFIRHFRRISGSPIPHQQFNDKNNDYYNYYDQSDDFYDESDAGYDYYDESGEIYDSYEECLKESSKVISSDDCGVEYEEELDPELVEGLCRSHGDDNNIIYDGLSANDSIDLGEDSNDDPRRLIVFNPDYRFRIQSRSWPHAAVMFIEFDATYYSSRCTGAMISNRWLLTAAHCIWSDGNFHTNIAVVKNVRDTAGNDRWIPQNRYTVDRTVLIEPAYKILCPGETIGLCRWSRFNFDIGLLRLTTNPGTSYFGFGHCDSWVAPQLFNDYQHPIDKGYELHRELNCPWDFLFHRRFETIQCSNRAGASGGPIWKIDPVTGSYTIYGVWTGEKNDSINTYDKNIATRLRSVNLATICAEIEQDQPGRC